MFEKRIILKLFLLFVLTIIFTSCVSVKPYQKMYLNDKDMELTQRKLEKYESGFQSYREGASGAESGKIGGGCGCN